MTTGEQSARINILFFCLKSNSRGAWSPRCTEQHDAANQWHPALVRSSISHLLLSFCQSTEPPRWERKRKFATMWNVLSSEWHPQHLFQASYRVCFLVAILSSPVTASGRKKLLTEKPQIPNKCHSEAMLTLRELV